MLSFYNGEVRVKDNWEGTGNNIDRWTLRDPKGNVKCLRISKKF